MIKKALESIKEIFIPVRSIADDIVVNMDGGVGGSWEEVDYVEIKGQKLELQQSELPKADYDS